MKIEVVSYLNGLSDKFRLKLTSDIINKSTADLILFSGHTIGRVNDINTLRTLISNKKTEVILELEDLNSGKIGNCLYHLKRGELKNLYTNQIFTQSKEIEGNYELADRLIHELETTRVLNIKGKSVLIIQCGEINILKNIQSANNRVDFRLKDKQSLENRFNKIIRESKIILNPIHTPMGNQGKMKKRREYLTKNNRYYFSACNTKKNSDNLNLKSLQYAYYNKKTLAEINKDITTNFISRTYSIEY